MRQSIRNSLTVFGFLTGLLILLGLPAGAHAAASNSAATPAGSIIITPAALTLTLQKGQRTQTASLEIINRYSTPVVVHMAIAQSVPTPGAPASAAKQMNITPADVSIPAGETAKPVITLHDSDALAPGSQQVELVASQIGPAGGTVSVVPSVRLAVTVIKEEGAVLGLSVGSLQQSSFAVSMPETVAIKVANTGNVVAIPHGFVHVIDPRGHEVSKSVLNTASTAVAPGGQLRHTVSLTNVGRAWLPGMYRLQVAYGQGGGTPVRIVSARFFYVPVWQILLLAVCLGMAYCAWQVGVEWAKIRRLCKDRPPAKSASTETPLPSGGSVL